MVVLLAMLAARCTEADDGLLCALARQCGKASGSASVLLVVYGPPSGYPNPFEGVNRLWVSVTGDGIGETSTFVDYSGPLDDVFVPGVAIGAGTRIKAVGLDFRCDATGGGDPSTCAAPDACSPDNPTAGCEYVPVEILSRGRSGPVDYAVDAGWGVANIFMMRMNTFAPTTSAKLRSGTSLDTGRVGHTATLLSDGRVLVAGGAELKDGNGDFTDPDALKAVYDSAEIYDPTSGTFDQVGATGVGGRLTTARAFHRAVLLPDGRVALFGGYTLGAGGQPEPLSSVEVFDPETGLFYSDVPGMGQARAYHTATPKQDGSGQVVLIGGRPAPAAGTYEVWDPTSGSLPLPNPNLQRPRIS